MIATAAAEVIWIFIGLALTIVGTFVSAAIVGPFGASLYHPLGVTYQVGAVLLTACLGGKNAAAIAQVAYLALGLQGLPIFTQGGGVSYYQEPSFGYLLGFVPGAWLCGWLAFRWPSRLEYLGLSSFCGLMLIHAIGLSYLMLGQVWLWGETKTALLPQILNYSVYPLPGQVGILCAVTVVAYMVRLLLFY